MTDSTPATAAVSRFRLPLDERLALALAEDCATELDESDVQNAVQAVLPVALRYGALPYGPPDYDVCRRRVAAALNLTDRFDPTSGADRVRTFVADLTRILRGETDA